MSRNRIFQHSYAVILISIVMQACQGMQVRDRETLNPVAEKARAGNETAVKALERTLEQPVDESLKKEVLSEMGTVKTPRAREVLKQKLADNQLRGAAALAYSRQKDGTNDTEIDSDLTSSLQDNQLKYGTLTNEEIQVLGDTSDARAIKLLKSQLGINRENDALVIQALAKQLQRGLSTRVVTPADPAPKKEEPVITEPAEVIEKTTDTPVEKPAPAVQPLAEEDFIPAIDDIDLDGKGDSEDEETAEQVLREYTESDAPDELKDLALDAIYQAYKEEGRAHLLSLAENPEYSLVSRRSILMFLARKAKAQGDSSLVTELQTLRKKYKKQKDFVREIDSAIALLKDLPAPAEKPVVTTVTKKSSGRRKSYVADKEPSLPKKNFAHKNQANVRHNLQSTLLYYGLSQGVINRMDSRVQKLLIDPAYQNNSERNLIFVTLEKLYPGQDYFTLKKYGRTAFDTPWYFTTTLKLVTRSGRGKNWQVAAISRLWGLTTHEATVIRSLYLKEGKSLAGKMKL